jgi:phosphatidylglycerophosphate synthase
MTRPVVWLISSVRILLIVPLTNAIVRGDDVQATWLLAAAIGTDLLDGWLARRWRVTSDAGALMDASCDAVVLLPTLWLLADQGRFLHAPLLLSLACLAHFVLSDPAGPRRYDPIGRHLGTLLFATVALILLLGSPAVVPTAAILSGAATLTLIGRTRRADR